MCMIANVERQCSSRMLNFKENQSWTDLNDPGLQRARSGEDENQGS